MGCSSGGVRALRTLLAGLSPNIGVPLMTGANDDGADGLKTLRERGGVAIVQSPDDAETPFMPAAGIERAGADHVVPLADIAPLLNRLCLS